MTKEVKADTVQETPRIKLAQAKFATIDIGPDAIPALRRNRTDEPDKMAIPKKWKDLVEIIRFYYERDPIVSTTIDKQVDIGINNIRNNQGEASDEVYEVYESFKDDLYLFLKDYLAREYLLSGLVIPEFSLTTKSLGTTEDEMDIENDSVYTVPTNFWTRDPSSIEIKKTPIPNKLNYYVIIDSDMIEFILNGGVYSDGTRDKETYELLVRDYPDFVAAIRKGQEKFPLDPFVVIRRAPVSGKAYPTPYLVGILESLTHKRNLRKMDYSIAARVISAIQLVTLGNDEYPLTEGDEDQFDDLRTQILHRGRKGDIERVFQLFGNHTVNIEWIYPDTEAMLDDTKYEAVNNDIMFGLGFPRILLSGETERSFTSNPEFAMFSPSETIKSMRRDLMIFVNKLYKQIAELNGFDNYPTMQFEELRLYDLGKISSILQNLYEKGFLSRTTYLQSVGYDFETEIHNIKRERELMDELDIPEFAPQPFTPQPESPNSNPQPETQPEEE